jgi:exocyst complex component 2
MTDAEGNVTNHYNLPTAYPLEWPAELDQSDEDEPSNVGAGVRRSRSRYSALERSASDRRSALPGFQKTGDGRANLVQKDEPDPLGGPDSVVRALKQRRLPVEEDSRLRNKFLLSSTTFSPALFLSQTHPDATTQQLVQGLDYLTKSIDQKSASLKVLVESNFERFVRAKATIDNVYTEMRNQGVDDSQFLSGRHSRQISRSSGHLRNFSGGSTAVSLTAPNQVATSKNALRKESEYGVLGIKAPLLEVSQKAQDVWGPTLGGREKESSLKVIVEEVEKEKQLYELGASLSKSIKQKHYDVIVSLYNVARRYSMDAKRLADGAASGRQPLTDENIHRILVTGRMWADVESQINVLKRDIWRRLSNVQSVLPVPGGPQTEEHMELIGVLLELGVDDNPIWVWLLSRYDYLKTKISAVSDRSKVEIEILRRRLAQTEKPSPQTTAAYLRQAGKEGSPTIDSDQVLEMWQTVLAFMTKLLSLSSGLIGEVVDFWESTQSFIDGHKQKALPTGFEGQSAKHHRLSDAGVRDLQNGAVDLINRIRESVMSLFADPPTEDISSLFSPLPQTSPNTPMSAVFSPTDGRLGRIDESLIPPPSPKKGEAWEDFAFWPPHSNSLSSTQYLSKIIVLVGTAASVMASLGPASSNSSVQEKIKAMIGGIRERCVKAVCDSWNKDAESCKSLEDWTRAPDRRDLTKMPAQFMAFEKSILSGMQRIVYYSDVVVNPGSPNIISPPSSKLLQIVKTQFVTSIYKALNGMVENAERQITQDTDDWVLVTAAMANADIEPSSSAPSTIAVDAIDVSSRNVRMLVTLSNLKALKIDLVPQLVSFFESSFSIKLTDETKTIRDVLGQIDNKLFQSYTRPTVTTLSKAIRDGINAADWMPSTAKPDQVKPYVYAVLLNLVMVHTEISTTVPSFSPSSSGTTTNSTTTTTTTTTGSALLAEILSFLLEKVSEALLSAFKDRKPNTYTLSALMQATLDTEFIAQTMGQYATKKATDMQSEIYMELDRRTNNESRAQLQKELGDMRIVLKRLREGSRGTFGCFKKVRPERKAAAREEK